MLTVITNDNDVSCIDFSTRMAEKAIFSFAEDIYYRNRKLAGKFITTTMVETTALTYSPILEPKLSKSSTKLCKNKRKLPEIETVLY